MGNKQITVVIAREYCKWKAANQLKKKKKGGVGGGGAEYEYSAEEKTQTFRSGYRF